MGHEKKDAEWLPKQTPVLIGYLFRFQLYAFVVVEVHILVNGLASFGKGGMGQMAEIFFFEMAKEVLCGGLVPSVAPPRHGGGDVILPREDSRRLRSVLMSLVTVEDQLRSDLFFGGPAGECVSPNRWSFRSQLMSHDKAIE
jgi:hypothetical protein